MFFLVKKFGKLAAKPLKSMILDFYGVDELCRAKYQLMTDVTSMNLDITLPHIPERRDGDSKAVRIVDDLFTMLTFLDENFKLSQLPCYVADSPDAMPSSRLYEGDLSVLMKVRERMENEIKELHLALAAIAKDIQVRPNDQATQRSARNAVNSDVYATTEPCTVVRNLLSTGGGINDVLMTSRHSRQLLADPRPMGHHHAALDWATTAAAAVSTPVAIHNRFSVLSSATDDDDDISSYTDVTSRRPNKRQRNYSRQLQQQ